MIMRDYVTAKERLTFAQPKLVDFLGMDCAGCGRTSEAIAFEDGCDDEGFEENSRTTNSGMWYCHTDCFRDSR